MSQKHQKRPNFTKSCAHRITFVALTGMQCALGFVDIRHFSQNGANGPESKKTRMFRPVRQVAEPAAKSAVSYCILFGCCNLISEECNGSSGTRQMLMAKYMYV